MNTERIEKLLHTEEIRNLRIKYSHYLDSYQLEELTMLFTEDATVQTDRDPWHGRAGIYAGLDKAFKEYDRNNHGNYPFLHAVTNHWIEITSPTTAQGKCYLIDLVTGRPKNEKPLLLLGLYADEYVLIGNKWYISKSRLDVVWPERNNIFMDV
ncbi:nuclear transport factor 2 family protein [Pedobacter sp. AW31-3R]|uniref:nuclear transport factor 2 family protein n=1 Tax=Pedobacter sp. AW31-3R TaxID=3445781 RepID=UPI003FA065D9